MTPWNLFAHSKALRNRGTDELIGADDQADWVGHDVLLTWMVSVIPRFRVVDSGSASLYIDGFINFSVMRSLSPISAYFARSTSPNR